MATTYIAPTVKQFVDGAMVAFYDASATSAIEAAFESSTQTATSPVNDTTIAILGEAFSTSSLVTGNITADLQHAAVNLTGSQITVSGELNAFLAEYNQALADGFTGAQAEGITIASFTASTLGAVAGNLGLTPTDLTAFQTQQQAAINRSNVSGNYAELRDAGLDFGAGDNRRCGLGGVSKRSRWRHQRSHHGDDSGGQDYRSGGGHP